MRFDRAVEYYDRTRALSDEAWREMTLLLSSELHDRGLALEIGVGTGLVALPLAAAGVSLVGLDLSAPMLAKLVEKAGGRLPFPLVVGDATTLPFADHRFGAAVVRHVLHLIPPWRRVVAELVRVVVPGGLVLVSSGQVPEPWHELTDRFMDRVGRPSFADALDSWETGAILRAFRAHGAEARQLPRITQHVAQTLGEFLDQMAAGMHSWTWEVEEERRREAVAELRTWALERWGSLDPPGGRDVAIEWLAFDLP
ncbi:MAG TPA: class I SAM-dependent methyltransferase [Actinomycetota bacterium]|nr:class I SAM-dependent methyltransferase [Actinomycetota bacterium]